LRAVSGPLCSLLNSNAVFGFLFDLRGSDVFLLIAVLSIVLVLIAVKDDGEEVACRPTPA